MNKNLSAFGVVILFVIALTFLLHHSPRKTNSSVSTDSNAPQLFADTPEAQYAYLISTDNYDDATQQALTGFTVDKKSLPDGSMQITLNATNPEYTTQVYTVKPGEKLYFIERFLGDDEGTEDKNLKDDMAVLVDANGYVVQQ